MSIFKQKWGLRRWKAILFLLFCIAGCGSKQPLLPTETESPSEPMAVAKEAFEKGDHDKAAEILLPLLIQRPDDPELTLLTAQVEAARGNSDSALDLANAIDIKGRFGIVAAELRYRQSLLARNESGAEVALNDLISLEPEEVGWKHEQWFLFNLQGRRQEACEIADRLCQQGLATDDELMSLIRRTETHPFVLPNGQTPETFFFDGLGVARWYYSQKDYALAIQTLNEVSVDRQLSPAAKALYGRLLAETQSLEQLPTWQESCGEEEKRFGDYWAAVGQVATERGESQVAVSALLHAVYLNPTDRISYQRLGRALDSIGRAEDAAQFRYRGIDVAATENALEELSKRGNNIALRKSMSRKLMDLGRPFETLQWTESFLPRNALRERLTIKQQREKLLADQRALTMASESSMLGLDRPPLPDNAELSKLFGDSSAVSPILAEMQGATQLATPRFVDVAPSIGLDFQWYHDDVIDLSSIPIYQSIGGGIAVLDYDLDGWPDLYLAQGSAKPPHQPGAKSNQLFRNMESRFIDQTRETDTEDFSYSSGQAIGDVNQDGFPDIYVGNLGRNRLLINNGDGTFSDQSISIAAHVDTFTTSVAIADVNGDALPDIYEANYIEMERAFELPKVGADGRESQPSPLEHYAQSDRWFRSLGDGMFQGQFIDTDIAKAGTSLGIVVADFNDDRRNEIFVGNDERPNHYLVYDVENGFRNVADALGCAYGFNGAAMGCMGIATGDFNRDGTLDLQIANFKDESANLYLQNRSGAFVDSAVRYGLDQLTLPYVGFGTKALDIDRNGWDDFIVTNGHIFDMRHLGKPFQMPPQVLMANGKRYDQVEVDDPSGYFGGEYLGRSISMIDFDNDRSMDFLVGHLDAKLALLRNETEASANFLQLELVGSDSERDATGAVAILTADGQSFSQWVTAGDGYLSSDQSVIDLGLGNAKSIESLVIKWPSGRTQSFGDVAMNRRYLAIENEPMLWSRLTDSELADAD